MRSRLDARGTGGYVMLAPSMHVSGRRYAWGNENAPDDMGKFVLNCDRLREEIGATVLGVIAERSRGRPFLVSTLPAANTQLRNCSHGGMLLCYTVTTS